MYNITKTQKNYEQDLPDYSLNHCSRIIYHFSPVIVNNMHKFFITFHIMNNLSYVFLYTFYILFCFFFIFYKFFTTSLQNHIDNPPTSNTLLSTRLNGLFLINVYQNDITANLFYIAPVYHILFFPA